MKSQVFNEAQSAYKIIGNCNQDSFDSERGIVVSTKRFMDLDDARIEEDMIDQSYKTSIGPEIYTSEDEDEIIKVSDAEEGESVDNMEDVRPSQFEENLAKNTLSDEL